VGYSLDPALWALAISASLCAGVWTFFAFRRRGLAAGLRGAAWVLLPFAALFTGTLTLLLRVLDASVTWAAGLAFSPVMWFGLVLLGLAVVLFVVARLVDRRAPRRTAGSTAATKGSVPAQSAAGAVGATPTAADEDPELAEIEAILRNRGIT
jgi:hypothetical protein